MTIAKQIAFAQEILDAGNREGYETLMAGMIRASLSARQTNAAYKNMALNGYAVPSNR